jgi:hypothetical protein
VRSRLGLPRGGFREGNSGLRSTQSSSASWIFIGAGAASAAALVAGCDGRGGGGVLSWRRARRALWQRRATAWWALRHSDHPSLNSRSSSGLAIARMRRRTSGTPSVGLDRARHRLCNPLFSAGFSSGGLRPPRCPPSCPGRRSAYRPHPCPSAACHALPAPLWRTRRRPDVRRPVVMSASRPPLYAPLPR